MKVHKKSIYPAAFAEAVDNCSTQFFSKIEIRHGQGLRWTIATVATAIVLSATCVEGRSAEYVVAASKGRWRVDLASVDCMSLVSKKVTIFQKDASYDPKVMAALKFVWPNKQMYRDNPQCRYVLVSNILSKTNGAVRYRGRPSTVSMAFQICQRNPDQSVNAHICSYKNIYLFRQLTNGDETFELGLRAFARPQVSRWAVMKIRVSASNTK